MSSARSPRPRGPSHQGTAPPNRIPLRRSRSEISRKPGDCRLLPLGLVAPQLRFPPIVGDRYTPAPDPLESGLPAPPADLFTPPSSGGLPALSGLQKAKVSRPLLRDFVGFPESRLDFLIQRNTLEAHATGSRQDPPPLPQSHLSVPRRQSHIPRNPKGLPWERESHRFGKGRRSPVRYSTARR